MLAAQAAFVQGGGAPVACQSSPLGGVARPGVRHHVDQPFTCRCFAAGFRATASLGDRTEGNGIGDLVDRKCLRACQGVQPETLRTTRGDSVMEALAPDTALRY